MVRDDVLVIVLAGGAGERLSPLTRDRAKPAVYFGGPYRIIDFVSQQLHQLRAAAGSSSPRSTSRCRSTVTSGRAGPSCRRSSASSSRSCRRRNASASTGIRAPPTPSIRTSIRSSAKRRATSSCSPAITSTRWTTGRCCGSTSTRRRRHAGRDRSADRGRHALRHRGRRRRPTASSGFQEKPRSRRRCRASRTWRSPRWASTSSTATCWSRRSKPTRPNPTASTISARTSSRR